MCLLTLNWCREFHCLPSSSSLLLKGIGEIHITIPPHRLSNPSATHASSIFPSSTPAPPAVTSAGAGAGVGARAGVKAGAGEGMANPMDTPPASGAVLGPTPSGQLQMELAGSSCRMPQLSSMVKSRETSSPAIAWKWDLDAAASTLRSRAQGNTKALWDGWDEKGLRAGSWGLGTGRRRPWPLWGAGRGPCEEQAPTLNGEKIVEPDHAAAFSALLFRFPTDGGQRYPWRRQVGQALSLFLSLSLALSSSLSTWIYLHGSQFTMFLDARKGNKWNCRWPGPTLARTSGVSKSLVETSRARPVWNSLTGTFPANFRGSPASKLSTAPELEGSP